MRGFIAFCVFFFFLMIRRPPRSTRTDTLFPYTTLFRSALLLARPGSACRQGGRHLHFAVHRPARRYRPGWHARSEEHTSELQSLMRISYAVFCLKKKTKKHTQHKRLRTRLKSNHNNKTTHDSTYKRYTKLSKYK